MIEPRIIYEDENFLAIDKPAGLLVHKAHNTKHVSRESTLVDWVLGRYPKIGTVGDDPKLRPGIVHRLDRETSGVMLVAKNQKYFDYLKSLFQNRQIRKTYLALVLGKMEIGSGVIDKPIGIGSGTLKRSVRSEKMSKDAFTEYRVVKYIDDKRQVKEDGGFSLLEVKPKTGRTHQIRVHLASIGHPVAGDSLYGPKKLSEAVKRLMLHALSLEFTTADGRRIKIEAEPPEEFVNFLQESI